MADLLAEGRRKDTGQPSDAETLTVSMALTLSNLHKPTGYLNAGNKTVGSLDPVERAAKSGRPYWSTMADDVLPFDLDTPELVAAGRDLAAKLRADRRPVLFVPSGQSDHFHLFAVVADPQAREHWKARARARELTARKTMRPPGSPHRFLGRGAELVGAVEFLAAVNAERAERLTDDNRRQAGYWLQTLRTGKHHNRKDNSGSQAVRLITQGAIRAGWTLEQLQDALNDPDNAGGAAYRNRGGKGAKRADKWLREHEWKPAKAKVAEHRDSTDPSEDVQTFLAEMRAAVDRARMPGKAGATDRAVVMALLDRAEAKGVYRPSMDFRTIKEATGISYETIAKVAKRSPFLSVEKIGYSDPNWQADPETGETSDRKKAQGGRVATTWTFHIPEGFDEVSPDEKTPRILNIEPDTQGGCNAYVQETRS